MNEGLFGEYNIDIEDNIVPGMLKAASNGNKEALQYLENSDEVQKLFAVLNAINGTYTTENFDAVRAYLKENPSHLENFHFTFDDFYLETFNELLWHLMNNIFELQSLNDRILWIV